MTNSPTTRIELREGIPVRLQSFVTVGKGKLLNLSSSGAYIATAMYLLPQASVRLSIVLRDERRWVETDAVVVWENRGTVGRRDGLPPGYGFRFVAPDEETANVIAKLLQQDALPEATSESVSEDASAQASAPESIPEPAPPAVPPSDEPEVPPFSLREEIIRLKAPEKQPGVFVLSYDRTQEARVGRADDDLQETLKSFEGEYAYFYFEAIDEEDERYFRECELFHRLGGDRGQLDNTTHPDPPEPRENDALECPVCVAERTH